ncbi:hypothetical protein AB0M54_27200 [Actinoplanes sp. NPDC051470]|uniref:hypothetical protein n=1 Tax=Actinoplanes sp. NPDC051470 TaxID=3157224 RepID=UPI00342845D7
MTGWVIERTPLGTLASSVAPTSAPTTPMPPHSQGAERRGRRWALRAFVIGGLAGAAWLLTGAAAQAADHDPATEVSSLVGTVLTGSSTETPVDRVLQAATRPLDTDRPATRKDRRVTAVLDEPLKVVGAVAHAKDDAAPVLSTADHVVRDLTGPSRLTDGATDPEQIAPVAAPLTRTPDPVPGSAQALPAAPEADETESRRPAPAESPVTDAVATRIADPAPPAHVVSPSQPAGPHDAAAPKASAGTRHAITRHAITAAEPGRTPGGGDLPASPQVQFGALSGISTNASGAPTEGGSAAFLPAAVASGSVASHRLLQATDVEVRRHDAEAPTVSPD